MSKSEYALRMARLSNRIFGELITKTDQKSMKVVKMLEGLPAHKNPDYVKYYPPLREITHLMEMLRGQGLYRDEYADMRDLMEERRKARGVEKKIPFHIQKRLNKEAEEKQQTKQFE